MHSQPKTCRKDGNKLVTWSPVRMPCLSLSMHWTPSKTQLAKLMLKKFFTAFCRIDYVLIHASCLTGLMANFWYPTNISRPEIGKNSSGILMICTLMNMNFAFQKTMPGIRTLDCKPLKHSKQHPCQKRPQWHRLMMNHRMGWDPPFLFTRCWKADWPPINDSLTFGFLRLCNQMIFVGNSKDSIAWLIVLMNMKGMHSNCSMYSIWKTNLTLTRLWLLACMKVLWFSFRWICRNKLFHNWKSWICTIFSSTSLVFLQLGNNSKLPHFCWISVWNMRFSRNMHDLCGLSADPDVVHVGCSVDEKCVSNRGWESTEKDYEWVLVQSVWHHLISKIATWPWEVWTCEWNGGCLSPCIANSAHCLCYHPCSFGHTTSFGCTVRVRTNQSGVEVEFQSHLGWTVEWKDQYDDDFLLAAMFHVSSARWKKHEVGTQSQAVLQRDRSRTSQWNFQDVCHAPVSLRILRRNWCKGVTESLCKKQFGIHTPWTRVLTGLGFQNHKHFGGESGTQTGFADLTIAARKATCWWNFETLWKL